MTELLHDVIHTLSGLILEMEKVIKHLEELAQKGVDGDKPN